MYLSYTAVDNFIIKAVAVCIYQYSYILFYAFSYLVYTNYYQFLLYQQESAVNIDYGVALLPPVKKRKLAPKKAPAIVTASETAAVESSTTVISEQ